ncbi:PAS domain-containing protein [Alistipes sp. dk3620]|uniref:PAS domain-containing protein n=1 Tax=unclassified Alistipes TaxID=2608932 RepID=UPI001295088E|nr:MULTISPECIES: PAS domain-containing protein [unclassified Alistipes]MQX28114.1 PAS domain-containing protein [Alistipes sp. dk3620]QGA23309.1 PAS domain-containing protein [Alistipes sp. dk3624]
MVREEQLLKRIQELETENEKLRTQLNRRTSGAVDGAAEQTRAKYADRILDTLPDMMTVWTNSGVITDLISSEETNHVGVPSERFIGMNIRELLPEEAYRNVRANLDHVLETKRGSTGRHDLTVDGELRHYENRIWPLDRDKVLCMCRDITEAVRTQKAMNDANKRMKLIEQVVSLGYWFYYSETNEFYAPDILPVLLERESGADSVNADYYFEHFVHPDDREKARQLLHYNLELGEKDYIEFRIVTDDKVKYLRHRVLRESVEKGHRVVEGYVQDVTPIIERYHELEILKYAVNNASEEIFCCSLDGMFRFANRTFLSHHRITDDVAKYSLNDLKEGQYAPDGFEALVDRLRRNGGVLQNTCSYELPDGESITMESMVYLLDDSFSDQKVVWFFCRDVTERVRQGNELKELNRLMEAILDNIPVYLFVKDPNDEFRYLYWNQSFVKHSGIPASQVIGKTDFEIFPNPADAAHFQRDDLELLKRGELPPFEEEYSVVTGQKRIVNTVKMLVPVEERKLPLLMGISWDITERKVIETELLEAKVKAEQSDQLKTAFLANMSHEIRTPLNAIVGFAKILPEITDEMERASIINIIDTNSDQLLMLINDILDLSKIEAGTIEFVDIPANLTDLCQNIYCTLIEKTAPGVQLVFEGAFDNLVTLCDPGRLSQVIVNLITNAIKFTKEGFIRYGYRLREDRVEFYVADTGLGIPEDKLSTIFTRFTKLNSFIAGTGLGLAICRMIVERQHGKIWAESKLGEGSIFRFNFPYRKC